MHDQARLSQSLLALVPVDGSSIGNQSLFEQLSAAFPDLSQAAFVEARDALIAQGVLQKGRGRGGSVKRSEAEGSAVAAKPAAVKKPARSTEKAAVSSMDDLKKTLWATADKLRANMDAAEYKHIVLGLIFLKYISDSFASRRAELERKLTDESDDYYLGDDDPELLAAELEDRDYYREVNVFWVPEVARWESIRSAAKQADIGKRIDDALAAIEAENPRLKNILDKRYARAQLPDGKLGELVDLVSTIGFGDDTGKARDLLGQVYEYFLGQFASAEGKKGGQFYTPASIVKTLVAVLNPHHGKVYDPCCGSGGMFVQSEKFIEAHGGKLGDVSIYGQESNPTTWRLAAMNLAIRGIDFNLGKEPADTFIRNQHADLRADFVLANPPFNISDWWHGSLEGDPRWVYGTPPQGNANYAWLQHMLYHLKPNGRAGIVLANGSMSSSQNSEGDIRKAMVEADVVEVMVALPGQLFFNTQIPACLWFLAKDKRHSQSPGGVDRSEQVLFIDARKLGTSVSRVQIELTDADIERIAQTVAAWRGETLDAPDSTSRHSREGGNPVAAYEDIPGFCRSVTLAEIAEHGHVLTPGRYVGAEEVEDDDEAFTEKMQRLTKQLGEQMKKGSELDLMIRQKLGGLGYEF
ncbi:restriction endonuclease subunit M [Pseudomonas abyssi]|uniref:site-specific DNA-methyltransferase (adenine-specific) n=1 Tax=Pseudomonas abyssi TaxID=170540 RepID=A0A2A3MCX8_9PSED|nr:class I SAM-dependent DNA methyltransferase [Pseudomonas abyssi]PBK02651.1 restriction endonuclease subunit M [Pseudomonas abyssi]|tara:strand:- start:9653 stop:11566 length:1914 start_codon:yes stop_codon:yes gene_type:complete